MRTVRIAVLALVTAIFCLNATTPQLADLPLQSSITVHGITWTFGHNVRVGAFVNGDFYVAGACTVTAITPAPTVTPAINGTVLNIPPGDQGTAFDFHGPNYRPQYRVYPPIGLKPGDALVSTISMDSAARITVLAWLAPNPGTESWCKTAAVLTCMAAPVATDAFRPSYCDTTQKLYYADSIRWNLLPNLPHVGSMTNASLHEWSSHFMNSPWLDVCFFGFDAPLDYMTHYSAETGRAVGIATLFLICDFTKAQKDSIMKGLLQYGIDLWGIVRGCDASRGWQAHGGHGSGRKWPMIFAGIMLGDAAMARPTVSYPNLRIGEDMQTSWDWCWATRDSNYVYTGHQGLWDGVPVSSQPGWGPYENTPPSQWYCCESGYTTPLGESYRRCCTSHAWIAEALSARLMGAMALWDHPEFFGYCDRWMTAAYADSAEIDSIKAERGWDFSADWEREGASWDAITNDMWKAYRNSAAVRSQDISACKITQGLTIASDLRGRAVKINYALSNVARVTVAVYDLMGNRIRLLVDGKETSGTHAVQWDRRDNRGNLVGSGCYEIVGQLDKITLGKRIIFVK
ncbi:MAG TPA: FlgD immunoglobulin-like domain containing protein [Chitinivibrionales bacterium]|nr:FlgD immunoglobulin-like domain containing protein [Chitinivibrionales bacterium]